MSYYEYCTQPNASARKYWTQKLVWGRWQRRYQHGKYNQDVLKYNQCLRQSKYGRARAEFEAGCKIVPSGEVDCNIQTGHTNPATVPGSVSQAGLGQDRGSALAALGRMDKRILIGAAVTLVLIAR